MLTKLRESKSLHANLLILPTLIFMVGLLIIPLLLTLVISFGTRGSDGSVIFTSTLDNYIRLFTNSLYADILLRSLLLALQTTLMVILLAFPLAYFIARAPAMDTNSESR